MAYMDRADNYNAYSSSRARIHVCALEYLDHEMRVLSVQCRCVAYFVVPEDFFKFLLRDAHPDPIRAVHHEDYRVHVAVRSSFRRERGKRM